VRAEPPSRRPDRFDPAGASLLALFLEAQHLVGPRGKALTLVLIRLLQDRSEDDAAREHVGRSLADDESPPSGT
jgi:hypothetical protein